MAKDEVVHVKDREDALAIILNRQENGGRLVGFTAAHPAADIPEGHVELRFTYDIAPSTAELIDESDIQLGEPREPA